MGCVYANAPAGARFGGSGGAAEEQPESKWVRDKGSECDTNDLDAEDTGPFHNYQHCFQWILFVCLFSFFIF